MDKVYVVKTSDGEYNVCNVYVGDVRAEIKTVIPNAVAAYRVKKDVLMDKLRALDKNHSAEDVLQAYVDSIDIDSVIEFG